MRDVEVGPSGDGAWGALVRDVRAGSRRNVDEGRRACGDGGSDAATGAGRGGNADDELNSVEPTADGGYLLGGWSRSGANGDKTRPNAGRTACWILKVEGCV